MGKEVASSSLAAAPFHAVAQALAGGNNTKRKKRRQCG
jgi:hypothetical protein